MYLELNAIEINNYKSVYKSRLELNDGSNNTYILTGKNGTGKSKILEAITIQNIDNIRYNSLRTIKHKSKNEPVCIKYISNLKGKRPNYLKELKNLVIAPSTFWKSFTVSEIAITYTLNKGSSAFIIEKIYKFAEPSYDNYCYRNIPQEEITEEQPQLYEIIKKEPDTDMKIYKHLSRGFIEKNLLDKVFIFNINSNLWTSKDKYILQELIDVNSFRSNPDISIPMKNIFHIAGYKNKTEITNILAEAMRDELELQNLESKLSLKTTDFIHKIWKDKLGVRLKFKIGRDSSGQFKISTTVIDTNEINGIYSIGDISDGFKQFLAILLIFNIKEDSNNIIAIDEPEVHLHPSAAMYLKERLIELGKKCYVFFSTHTPFMIDANVSERHYKIQKKDSITNIQKLAPNVNMNDDDLTEELFGINTLRDFYAPNRMLVEGQVEKTIIDFALRLKNPTQCIVITNGKGSNIEQVASYINIKKVNNVLTIVDSDTDGNKYKKNIIKIGGVFSNKNVFCLKDICPELPDSATIEDLIDKNYVSSKFNEFLKNKGYKGLKFIPKDREAILIQIKDYCSINQINLSETDIKDLKTIIAENFNVRIGALKSKSPYLNEFTEYIIKHFTEVNNA